MNLVHLTGAVGSYGVNLSDTEQAKPHTSLTLVVEEPGKRGASYKTFVPVRIGARGLKRVRQS